MSKTTTKPRAPRIATPEALAKYGTTPNSCTCPDRTERGGSQYDEIQQDSCCYHMLTLRNQLRAAQQPVRSNEPPAGMVENPAYTDWLFDHFTDKPMEAEPPKFIADPVATDPIVRAAEMRGEWQAVNGAQVYTVDLEASRQARVKQQALIAEAEALPEGSPAAFQAAAKAVGHPNFVGSLTPAEVAAADAAVDAPATVEPRPWLDAFTPSDDDHLITEAEMIAEAAEYAAELGAMVDDETPLSPAEIEGLKAYQLRRLQAQRCAARSGCELGLYEALDTTAGNHLAITEALAALPRKPQPNPPGPVAALLVSLRPQLDTGAPVRRAFG